MPLLGTNQLMLKGMLQGTTLFSLPWKVESRAHLLVELWIQEKKCSCSHNHGTPDQLLTQVRLCESVMGPMGPTSLHMLWRTIGEGIDAYPLGNLMGGLVWLLLLQAIQSLYNHKSSMPDRFLVSIELF